MELSGREKLTDASRSTVYENGESGVPFMNAINTEPGKMNKYCYPFFSPFRFSCFSPIFFFFFFKTYPLVVLWNPTTMRGQSKARGDPRTG